MRELTIAVSLLALLTVCQQVVEAQHVQRTSASANTVRVGFAAHYGAGRMERAASRHGLSAVRCMVASSYYDLGTWLSVTSGVTGRTALCRVSDVTAQQHVALVRRRNIVIEFGAANIKQMCNLDRVGQEPPNKCPVTVRLAK